MDAKPHLKITNFAFRFERKNVARRERVPDREQHREEKEVKI